MEVKSNAHNESLRLPEDERLRLSEEAAKKYPLLKHIIEFANNEKWKCVMDLAFRLYEELHEKDEKEKLKKIESAGGKKKCSAKLCQVGNVIFLKPKEQGSK